MRLECLKDKSMALHSFQRHCWNTAFFIDIQERRICLSPALSQSFWNAEASCELFLDEFLSCFTPESADTIIGSLHRLSDSKHYHTDIQVTFSGSDKEIPALLFFPGNLSPLLY